jgi:hypothetical protein
MGRGQLRLRLGMEKQRNQTADKGGSNGKIYDYNFGSRIL